MENKQRLFVDMDGTLAVFKPVDKLETLYEERYFADLTPHENVVGAIKEISLNHPEIEVYILSAYLTDSPAALPEKNEWLDRHLQEVPVENRIFLPCGEDKKDFIRDGVRGTDFLLDDYTNNLMMWEPPGRGVKLLNGINHTNGTWDKDCVRFDSPPGDLADKIMQVMAGEHIREDRPQDEPVAGYGFRYKDYSYEQTAALADRFEEITGMDMQYYDYLCTMDSSYFEEVSDQYEYTLWEMEVILKGLEKEMAPSLEVGVPVIDGLEAWRDNDGRLTIPVEELAQKTLAKAHEYYKNGNQYLINGEAYTFRRHMEMDEKGNLTQPVTRFERADGKVVNVDPERLGTFLPGIASKELAISAAPTKPRFQERMHKAKKTAASQAMEKAPEISKGLER